ncbi:hypothetical protein BT96DRAFT_1008299 [Gymnopus androsaceus JB14]|uniref:Uncharacterized protein n=1 Tax=Gymnopus androsaceus JB14 TaxID=1447944 RepID=A0A6A4GFI2_9AGAR|nr:hypothetical protein BT96DRAFT_1008299 [Gymnopus androsaceus JB14]
MDNAPLGHMVAIPATDMVDASQVHRNELKNPSLQPQAGPKPNYQPSRDTRLFAKKNDRGDGLSTGSAAARFVSAALADISNSSRASDTSGAPARPACVPEASADASSNISGNASASSDAPTSDSSSAAVGAFFTGASPSDDASVQKSAALTRPPSEGASATGGALTGSDSASLSNDASSGASAVPTGVSATPTNVSVASDSSTAFGAGSATAADSGSPPDTVPGSGDASVHEPPPRKKKRLEMGEEERRLMRKAAEERSEKLAVDIDKLLDEQEELFTKYADLNDISVERIKKLANQLPSMKPQKKSSDYNILVYFKGKEVNAGRGKGSRTALKDLHAKVKEDEDLQEIFQDPEAMKALRHKYDEEKAEEKVAAIRVSKRAQAKSVAEKVNIFQQEANFLYKSTDANSFGMVVRGLFQSTVVSAFYSRGPADAFFRRYFHIGVQDVLNLYESYVVTEEKVGMRKLYQSEMASEIVRMVTQGLQEITGNIVVPYKVNITGWPDDVPHSYPQRLAADHTKRLYDAWNSGEAHWYCMTPAEAKTYQSNAEKNGELEPRVRKKRADAGLKRRHDDDDDSEEDDAARLSKGSRRKRAVCDDSNEESGADDAPAKKKSRGTGEGTAKKKSVGAGKKLAGAGRGSRNLAGGSGGGKKAAGGGGKKSVGGTRKGGAGGSKKVAGGGMKTAGASKKSVAEKGKGKKKSQCFVVSDSDVVSDNNDDNEEDEAEFSG